MPTPLTPMTRMTAGLPSVFERLIVEHIVGQHLAQQVAQLVGRRGLAQLCALFHLGDDLRRRGCTDVRQDERFLQFLEEIIIDLDECCEHAVQRMAHRVRSFLKAPA